MIELTVANKGSKWWVGWPYRYVRPIGHPGSRAQLPDELHERLVEWWREVSHNGPVNISPIERFKTREQLLDALDRAVRIAPPPLPFQLVRNGSLLREYPAGPFWTCHVCGDTRPDFRIRTAALEVVGPVGSTFRVTPRYCADRPVCAAVAPVIARAWVADAGLDPDAVLV